ncbi:MAG: beta-ketoacyl-[acyl-carrier-protein] synthase family protein [Gammaproteobacteria bacterium]|nr:beta-ketoacyl-[acyl-carrier-protein] synthase family protein [Gammaproteobacteria bacterium]
MEREKILMTGMGVISPLGNDRKTFWHNLINGRCGIKRITGFDVSGLPTQIAGEITDFNPLDFMDKKTARRSARFTRFAIAVVKQAMEDSGLEITDENRHRIGVYGGTGAGALREMARKIVKANKNGWKAFNPLATVTECNNAPAYTVAYQHGITGPVMTMTTACNSGINALEVASDQMQLGKIDTAIILGVEVMSEFLFQAFCRSQAMSTRNDSPGEASRPFDQDRDGFICAEGAGAIILERGSVMQKRGAIPYAEIAGCGSTSDAYSLFECEPTGIQISRAMEAAMRDARVNRHELGAILAHGPSMEVTDRAETAAIHRTFGDQAGAMPVASIKGAIGAPMGSTNMQQVITAAMTLSEGIIPPTINHESPDAVCDLDYVPGTARDADINYLAVNSHAYGGGNSSVVMGHA